MVLEPASLLHNARNNSRLPQHKCTCSGESAGLVTFEGTLIGRTTKAWLHEIVPIWSRSMKGEEVNARRANESIQ